MKRQRQFLRAINLSIFAYLACSVAPAQQNANSPAVASSVPNLISNAGILKDENGVPITGTTGATFLLYAEREGGAPLWIETQNVTTDSSGHYEVQLGATSPHGFPVDLFSGGHARWLALQLSGQTEQGRVMIVAVPYAIKAEDSETVGGLPPSAFVRASSEPNANIGKFTAPGFTPGTITGVTAGTDLTGGGTSGNVTLNLDTTKVPRLNTANAFTGSQSVTGNVTATGQVQAGPAGILLKDGTGQSMQIISNPSPTGASAGAAQFIPNAGTLIGMEAYSVGLISGTFGDFYCHHGLVAGGSGVCYFADVANDAGHVANSFSQSVQFDSVNSAGADIFTAIRANPQNSLEVSSGGSPGSGFGTIRQVPTVFASLPACGVSTEGTTGAVTDSAASTWGTTITGGGINHVLAYCDGSHWTVAAK